ncbi:MAG TPA: hypothetical protein VFK57_16730 [Vicinamibacterales bacterium]|nr:hypothetical protein [Vicinamibacterales bacterium]
MRILRGLTSHVLPCGCVAGVYETYDGTVITLVDEREATCQIDTHENGKNIPDARRLTPPSEVRLHAERQRQS